MYKCNRCEKKFEKYKSLYLHMKIIHNVSIDQSYVEYYLNGVWPLCKCGCNEMVAWSYSKKGFCDYIQGHASRIKNNWGHNKKAIDASSETRRRQYASGDRKIWNVGLSKDINKSVKLNGELRAKAYTPEIRAEYSIRMRKNRLDGTVPTQRGENHSQWKGGVSEINVLARARVKLYKEWKYPILVRDGFKCVECGCQTNLHVHHDKEQMCEIVAKHIVDDIKPKTFEENEFIADAVVDYHINNKVSGITLCSTCHNELHPFLNFD